MLRHLSNCPCPRHNALKLPWIDHRIGGKAVKSNGRPVLGSSMHTACIEGYASTVRKNDNDYEKDCSASRSIDDFDRLHGRRRFCEQSTFRGQLVCQPHWDECRVPARPGRTLRSTDPASIYPELISGAALSAALPLGLKPDVACATPGFLRRYDEFQEGRIQ